MLKQLIFDWNLTFLTIYSREGQQRNGYLPQPTVVVAGAHT